MEHIGWNTSFPHLALFHRDRRDRKERGEHCPCSSSWCAEHTVGLIPALKETHESFFLANLACSQPAKLAQSDNDRPFHLHVDFWGLLQPKFPTREFVGLYDPQAITEYGSYRDTLVDEPDYYWYEHHDQLSDGSGQAAVPNPLSREEWRGEK